MEITIQVKAPELCAALKELADAMRNRHLPPLHIFTPQTEAAPVQPVAPAPAEAPTTPAPTPRKRRTKAEMEADAAAESANAASQAVSPVDVKEAAPESQAPLPMAAVSPEPAKPVSAGTSAPAVTTGYPIPTDLASLKAIAVSHATDIESGNEHVKFCLGKFSAATLSLLNPALYGQFAVALYGMRNSKKG